MSAKESIWVRSKPLWPLIPAAIYLTTFFVIVLVYIIYISFGSAEGFPSTVALQAVLQNEDFYKALTNTIIFALVGTPLELFLGVFLAVLVFKAYRGKTILRGLFIIPFAVPGLVVATLIFILFGSSGGFVNDLIQGAYPPFPQIWFSGDINWRGNDFTALSISLMGKIWRDMPISMLIILSSLNAIDQQLMDAAKTLGAGFRYRLTKILIPLLFPALTTVLLLRSVEMWKEFIFPYVLAKKTFVLGTFIDYLFTSSSTMAQREHEAAVVGLILVIGVILSLSLILFIMGRLKRWYIDEGVSQ